MIEKLLFLMKDMEDNFSPQDRLSKLIKREEELTELSMDDLYDVAAAAQIPPFNPEKKRNK